MSFSLPPLLDIKPILETTGDKFEKVGMVLSVAQAKKKMIAKVKSDIEGKLKQQYEEGTLTATVVHTENLAEAQKLEAELKAELPNLKLTPIEVLSLSVSCHIGPGALAIALQNNAFEQK